METSLVEIICLFCDMCGLRYGMVAMGRNSDRNILFE